MRDTLTLLASSTVLPPNPAPPPPPHHHAHHHLATTTSKPRPRNQRPRPSSHFTQSNRPSKSSGPQTPLLSALRWDHSTKYYSDLASKLAEDGRFEDFLMITESVVESGLKPSEFMALMNVKLVSSGISRLVKEGKVWNVVKSLKGIKKLGFDTAKLFDGAAMESMKQECRRIAKCGELEEILNLLETLQGFGFSVKELVETSAIVRLCITKRNPSAAVRFASMCPHIDILLCTIILEFGKKGDLASAITVFELSKKDTTCPNMYIYRAIIDACGLCGDYLKSRSIYEELLSRKSTPNIYVYNSLMNVNACDLSYTLYVYKQMQTLGVKAVMATYNVLLKSCCLAARVDLAQEIYKEVQSLQSTGALQLDVFTYSTMIKVFADAKMWQLALQIKEDMLSAGVTPNTVTWSSLISACANAGLVEQGIKLFEEMLQAGCEPNSQCCNTLLHACVEACQYDRAFRLFQSWKKSSLEDVIKHHHSKTDTNSGLGQAIASYPSQLQFNDAVSHHLHASPRIPFSPTTSTYNILMKACGTDFYRAKSLMDEMREVGLSPNHISWSILIDICGGSGNVDGALQILRSMREAGIQPDVVTYTTAIKVCVERKNLKFAFSLFAEMKKYQIKPNLVTYNTLLRARTRYGSIQDVQQCLAVYQDMRKAGYRANDYYLKQLIEEWCEGVIQTSNEGKVQFQSRNRSNLGPQVWLLEKVAEHLQKSSAESLSVDVRGLTKVEARIVVLAVLRMIKEKYTPGDLIRDDLLIILGIQKLGPHTAKHENVMKDGIIKLLQDDLGLEVLPAGSRIRNHRNSKSPSNLNANLDKVPENSALSMESLSPTRRPIILQRLKVTKKSLYHWLQRKLGSLIQ